MSPQHLSPNLLPSLFISDWGPMPILEEDEYTDALAKLGKNLPRPRAIIVMSSHWQTETAQITSAAKPETIQDYYGFPDEAYEKSYPAPGDPALAQRAIALLTKAGIAAQAEPKRGRDHAAWVPLLRVYSEADIPTIQISIPAGGPANIVAVGKALAPLRGDGVLLVGSGALSHNLGLALRRGKNDPAERWALEYDAWLRERILKSNIDELQRYRELAPNAKLAAPTSEHVEPFFFPLGAAGASKPRIIFERVVNANGLLKIIAWDER